MSAPMQDGAGTPLEGRATCSLARPVDREVAMLTGEMKRQITIPHRHGSRHRAIPRPRQIRRETPREDLHAGTHAGPRAAAAADDKASARGSGTRPGGRDPEGPAARHRTLPAPRILRCGDGPCHAVARRDRSDGALPDGRGDGPAVPPACHGGGCRPRARPAHAPRPERRVERPAHPPRNTANHRADAGRSRPRPTRPDPAGSAPDINGPIGRTASRGSLHEALEPLPHPARSDGLGPPRKEACRSTLGPQLRSGRGRAARAEPGGAPSSGAAACVGRARRPEAGCEGRAALPPETMLRGCLLQTGQALGRPMTEGPRQDSAARRRLAGSAPGDGRIPEARTIRTLCRRPGRHGPGAALCAEVNAPLARGHHAGFGQAFAGLPVSLPRPDRGLGRSPASP